MVPPTPIATYQADCTAPRRTLGQSRTNIRRYQLDEMKNYKKEFEYSRDVFAAHFPAPA